MDLQQTTNEPHAARPRWQRLLALVLCELVILQPALAAAQVAQVPMFTVTSVPPNVMLMFDDSASMQLLKLTPPAAFASPPAPPRTYNTNPLIKLNTQGYYGISGIKWYTGNGRHRRQQVDLPAQGNPAALSGLQPPRLQPRGAVQAVERQRHADAERRLRRQQQHSRRDGDPHALGPAQLPGLHEVHRRERPREFEDPRQQCRPAAGRRP